MKKGSRNSLARDGRGPRIRWIILVVLSATTLVAFEGVLECGFINFDDPGYVASNPQVQSGLSLETLVWSFKTTAQANWHPITWLSHALDCTLFGVDARYHHAMSLAIHLLSSIILFLLLEWMTGLMWQSAFVALVFAIHPLHVESVAWISERKDVLSGLFWVLTMVAYARHRIDSSNVWYVVGLGVFTLGLMTKPMLVSLPFVLVLLDYWPLRNTSQSSLDPPRTTQGLARWLFRSIRHKSPFFILALVSSVITFLVQQSGGSMSAYDLPAVSDRVLNAILSYGEYVRKTFWPNDLAIFYPHPGSNISLWKFVLSGVGLVVVSIVVWRRRLPQPYLLVGWLWFLGTLVPVIGVVQVGLQGMADRYMYLPMIGLSMIIAWGVPALVGRASEVRKLIPASILVLTLLMVVGTRAQVSYWKSSFSILERTLTVTANNHIAHTNLGKELADSGRHAEAVVHLAEAVRIRPHEALIRSNYARSLLALGRLEDALDQYRWIEVRVAPDPLLLARIGDIFADLGRVDESIGYFMNVVRLDSGDLSARLKLGELYIRIGEIERARRSAREVVDLQPTHSKAHDLLGVIAGVERRYDDAAQSFKTAIQYDSGNTDAYLNLGTLFERVGRSDDALAVYDRAVQVAPHHSEARYRLGIFLAGIRRWDEASGHLEKAAHLDPRSVGSRVNLGRVYISQGRQEDAEKQFAEALRLDPNHAIANYQFGLILRDAGRLSEAETLFVKAIRSDPTFRAAFTALEEVQRRSRQRP